MNRHAALLIIAILEIGSTTARADFSTSLTSMISPVRRLEHVQLYPDQRSVQHTEC